MNTVQEIRYCLNKTSGRYTLYGAGLAFILGLAFLSALLLSGGLWQGRNFWQIAPIFIPLLTITAGGAAGGMVSYLVARLFRGKPKKVFAAIAGLSLYALICWMCLIAGLSAIGLWD